MYANHIEADTADAIEYETTINESLMNYKNDWCFPLVLLVQNGVTSSFVAKMILYTLVPSNKVIDKFNELLYF